MSREGLSDFLNAAEHSASLRKKVRTCGDSQSLIDLARKYGFAVNLNDIKVAGELDKIENWFETSKIKPIKRIVE